MADDAHAPEPGRRSGGVRAAPEDPGEDVRIRIPRVRRLRIIRNPITTDNQNIPASSVVCCTTEAGMEASRKVIFPNVTES